ncbi:porin family protein [Winogradskyella ursingii]|uniref:porin family protein n=1 Tax=Winogradskyella ursingii TaxID=2686079 RepID=UPI0015CC883C|nr:porin family protein [Winogradskyella ursingii]
MKRNLLALLCLCLTTVALSQEVRYGIRGAINVSNLDFDPDANFNNEHRNGFAFGGFIDYGFSETVWLHTELQWSAEGGKEKSVRRSTLFPETLGTDQGNETVSLRADYIQMPIMLRFSLSERLIVGAGPQVALKTWKNEDSFSTFTFSGVAGFEYMITDELFVDARYSYGLSNILDDDFGDREAKNHVMQFGFGIKI